MSEADLRFQDDGDAVIVHVAGEIDMSNADDLRLAIEAQLSNRGRGLVLDLSGLEYLDSAGIHLVYALSRRLRARDQTLGVVVSPGAPAEATLRYAGVLDELGVQPTLADALSRLETAS